MKGFSFSELARLYKPRTQVKNANSVDNQLVEMLSSFKGKGCLETLTKLFEARQ